MTGFFNKILEQGVLPEDWAPSIYRPCIRTEKRKIQIITGVSPLPVAYVSFSLHLSLKGYEKSWKIEKL